MNSSMRKRTLNEGGERDKNVRVKDPDPNILTGPEADRALEELISELPPNERDKARNELAGNSETERQKLAAWQLDQKPNEKRVRRGTKILGRKA